jgi:hypothetical protein
MHGDILRQRDHPVQPIAGRDKQHHSRQPGEFGQTFWTATTIRLESCINRWEHGQNRTFFANTPHIFTTNNRLYGLDKVSYGNCDQSYESTERTGPSKPP